MRVPHSVPECKAWEVTVRQRDRGRVGMREDTLSQAGVELCEGHRDFVTCRGVSAALHID